MTTIEVMNESRRRKRIHKAAQRAGAEAAEAAAPSKKVRLVEQKGSGIMAVDEGEDVDSDDANADIMVSVSKEERDARHSAAKKASRQHVQDATEKKMSKTKMKALTRLKERQEREAKRSELYESLAKNSITQSETMLLKSSSKLGKGKATKKERLAQALKEQRVGINITDATGLVVGMDGEGMSARKKRRMEQERELRELQRESSDEDPYVPGLNQASGDEDDDAEEEGEDREGDEDMEDQEDQAEEDGSDAEEDDADQEQEGTKQNSTAAKSKQGAAGKDVDMKNAGRKAGKHSTTASSAESAAAERKPAFYIQVKRNKNMQEAREKLPMYAEEQPIMEAIRYNDVVVLCGATGSGKSTQLPQFLYEAGYGHEAGCPGLIGCTQPRRVAAVTTAKRVAKELNVRLGKEVGYQVRYEKQADKSTKIKFMTDGILLKELQSDFLLSAYSAIIVDEAHERGLNSDVLIGMLSRVVP
jgi:ATP-dependent RNA helicase DHX37/DHR1